MQTWFYEKMKDFIVFSDFCEIILYLNWAKTNQNFQKLNFAAGYQNASESQEDLSQVQPIAAHAMTGLPPVLDQSNQPTGQIDAIAKLEPATTSGISNTDFSKPNIKRKFAIEEEENTLTDIISSAVNVTSTHKRGKHSKIITIV